MTQKSSKKALIASLLIITICLGAFIGTTFAWFTDSVTSSGNVIQTGTLEVEMYWAEGTKDPSDASVWQDASNSGAIFESKLWEPGYVEARHIKIVNNGTLAIRYNLAIIPHGEVSKLADVIDVYYVDGATKLDTRDDLNSKYIGSLRELINNGIAVGSLLKDTEYDATIVLKMQETAGNEYQGLSIGSDFSIQLMATQFTSEKDSFNDQYDVNAFYTVNNMAQFRAAVESAIDTTTIFVQSGDYEIGSQITIEGKSINIVGLGVVNFKNASSHAFTIQDSNNPESQMNVTIKNINLDGAAEHGFNVKYNTVLNLENVTVKNTGWADVLLDNANKYNDDKFYNDTKTVVNLKNSSVEDVSMDTLPVIDTHPYKDAGVITYAYFNYDEESTVGVVEKQNISAKPETMFINGDNSDNAEFIFAASNDAELTAVLNTIYTNSKFWNKNLNVKLAAGEYSGDYVIYQYANGDPANRLNINFVGARTATTFRMRAAAAIPSVVFTGNVVISGAGAQNANTAAVTTFNNVMFDGASSQEADNENESIVLYLESHADEVSFVGCSFTNSTKIALGSDTEPVGKVSIEGCNFVEGGCLTGYASEISVSDTQFTSQNTGFIDSKMSESITVENSQIDCAGFFVRADSDDVKISVSDAKIEQTDIEGGDENGLIIVNGENAKVEFENCETEFESNIQGGEGAGSVEINDYYTEDGITYCDVVLTGEKILYLVTEEYAEDTVVVKEGVTAIGNYAFAYNNNVKTVILASTVRDLGRGFDSSTVEKVVLNEGLEKISSRAFRCTTALKEVVISSTVNEIVDNAFQKTGLKTIVIPANVKTIGETAFGASLIETVTFEGDIEIQGYAFRGCTALRTVYMNGSNVSFVKSTLNGRDSMWFCNGESNNPNTSNITFYVKNEVIKERVLTAMGAERNNTPVICAETPDENGEYTDNEGNKYVYVTNSEEFIAAITNKIPTIYMYDGEYAVRFTNNVSFNVDDTKIVALGENVKLSVSSSEVSYGRIQGNNVTFEGIVFVNDTVGTTGKATYNNCTFAYRLECASSNLAETYVNNCTMVQIHTSTDMNAGKIFVNNSVIAHAEYNARNPITFTECEIGTLIMWAGETYVVDCELDLNNVEIKGGTLYVDGKIFVSNGLFTDAEGVYYICNASGLTTFAAMVNNGTISGKTVKLMNDIDLEEEDWTPIGTSSNPFLGTFDGQGYTISNVWVTPDSGNAGFFGQVGTQIEGCNATVKNLIVNNATIIGKGDANAGLIAVAPTGACVESVKLTGEITIQGYRGVGGIVGNGFPTMNNCTVEAEGTITATYWGVGGILGFASDRGAHVNNSTVTGVGEGLTIRGELGGVGAVTGTPHGANTNGAVITDVVLTSNNNYFMSYVDASGVATNATIKNVVIYVSGNEIEGNDKASVTIIK